MYADAQADRGCRHSVEGKSDIGYGVTIPMLNAAARQCPLEIPVTCMKSAARPLDSGVRGPTGRGHAIHAAALPGLTENDKVMSD